MNISNFEFTPQNVSKYWNLLNNSNNQNDKKIANEFLIQFKKNCNQCLEISIELFKSPSLDDKIISSLIMYQTLKENPKKLLNNEQLYNQMKNYILNEILIPYTKENDDSLSNNIDKNKINLIIERVCYSMSIIILIGCCSFWQNAIDEMISFGKETIKHTYLMTIIFGNCNNELRSLFLTKKQEFIIKSKFIEKNQEFKNFINTIFVNTNSIDKKLYNKTIDLAINLTNFEVNVLYIPNLIKIVLSDINLSNIDSLSKLFTESINSSKSKKLEDEYSDLDISEYDNKITKDELESFTYLIDIIISYIQNHSNIEEDIAFGLGQIFSTFTENFVYMFFKKDLMSQKIFNLFFYFISHKIRKISQLFFETIPTMKGFINGNYKFSNYNDNEKIQFLNYLLKILLNIINNCTYKAIKTRQDILLTEEYITIKNNSKNDINNKKQEDDFIDEINEITIEDYRCAAEDVFISVFDMFASYYDKDGINYFFNQITKDIIPCLGKNYNEITKEEILAVEVVIYIIKNLLNSFEDLNLDKTPLNQFTLTLIRSPIISNQFILVNFLLFLDEESSMLSFRDNSLFFEIIVFLLNQILIKIAEDNSEEINHLISEVLYHICEACGNIFLSESWNKIYEIYMHYYDKFNFKTLYNITEALSCLLEIENTSENINILSNDEIISYFKKIVEPPVSRILRIGDIISKKNKEIFGNPENEKKLRFEIIKNFQVITCSLKHCSFIDDKNIINNVFDAIYKEISESLKYIINEYNKDSDIMNCFMNTFSKCSNNLNVNTLNSIYQNFNELMINSFLINNDNYQCIFVLKNIYSLKLNNIKDKNPSNKEYMELYNNFLKLNRQICSAIITSSNYKMELMLNFSLFFTSIFPQLNQINKDDYIIISDSIILLNEGIKTIVENTIINNILYAFISFIESPNSELINQKYTYIIKGVFSSFDHFNSNIIKAFTTFCSCCLKINKRDFMLTFKEVLNSPDFSCFNDNNKNIIYNYVEYFSAKIDKLKKLFECLLNIIQRKYIDSIDDIMEKFYKEMSNELPNKKTITFI